jgi:hypothetical protein
MTAPLPVKQMIGTHDLLFVTLDTLRYDVAREALAAGRTPHLAALLPDGQWEARHSPGTFTYAAHHAFFAGFLPTPISPQRGKRLFAARFPGSETTGEHTFVYDTADLPNGLAAVGYHTVCIGGVGFFNKQSALGSALPNLFHESHWSEAMGVTSATSSYEQVKLAVAIAQRVPPHKRLLMFINISAMHQPNHIFTPGATQDTAQTQAAALAYVDQHLPPLFAAMQQRAPTLCILCADHGTAYGEDGYHGHRLAHPTVWTVPYAEFVLPQVLIARR